MNVVLVVALVYTVMCCYATSDPDPPSQYTGCQSSAQCGPQHCCVLVEGRYPTTSCEPRRRPRQQCRPPSDRPQDLTLNYPGGASVSVRGVHRGLCPCETGAVCSSTSGLCVAEGGNHIY